MGEVREDLLIPSEEGKDLNITPVLRQYQEIHSTVPSALLLFQVGDFYEAFFDDAVRLSSALQIHLTTRSKNDPNPVPMAGIPVASAEGYISRLLKQGITVAICDQVGEERGGLMERKITRIFTPGTSFLDDDGEEGWVVAYVPRGEKVGIARLHFVEKELSSGELDIKEVFSFFALHPPREVLHPQGGKPPAGILPPTTLFREYPLPSGETLEEMAVTLVKEFLKDTLNEDLPLSKVTPLIPPSTFPLDLYTVKNLEIFENLSFFGKEGTLFSFLRFTLTPMGERGLRQTLRYPYKTLPPIFLRQDRIAFLLENPSLLKEVRSLLEGFPDLDRITVRLALRFPQVSTLLSLRESLQRSFSLKELLIRTPLFHPLFSSLKDLEGLKDLLEKGLLPKPSRSLEDGGVIQPDFHPQLREYLLFQNEFLEKLKEWEEEERSRTEIPTLKIGYNRVFGYYIEVPRSAGKKVPPYYIRKQTLSQVERYITPQLKEWEEKLLLSKEKALKLEREIFSSFVEESRKVLSSLAHLSSGIKELDIVQSLATVAQKYRWVRPVVREERGITIVGGKHPVLSSLSPFVPNDTVLNEERSFLLLTGPNMGGKSTYLRQVGIIVLLSQIGSFVPAEHAEVGLVDQIFTRVGAGDILWQGRSTFFVEMEETAHLLRKATIRSLVLLDEVGRGTSTYDGLSIAQAVAEYLIEKRIFTLFATHYHELTILQEKKNVSLFTPDLRIHDGRLIFLYQIIPGFHPNSYGIDVAKMAGIPEEIIQRAKEILMEKEDREKRENPHQLTLFSSDPEEILREIEALDPEKMTIGEILSAIKKLKALSRKA